jgi:nicotinate-nucleotide pyrophosphorylase (carboxylating)
MNKQALQLLIQNALAEDIGSGDYSTLCCIPPQQQGKAVLKVKQNGILAGMQVAKAIFEHMEPTAVFEPLMNDGDTMQYGDIAYTVNASVHTILQCERLALNCMQRMSGIATLTNQYVQLLKPYKTKILDTRKTTPNFRLFEKEAVVIGGGWNHRFGLYDMIMLKDNHIDYCGGIEKAIAKANEYIAAKNLGIKIEVETRSIDDVKRVLAVGGVHRIMLDNYTPAQVGEAVLLINGQYETEASGGINLQTIESYAQAGVDYVSSGALIHQAVSLDLSLKAAISNV